MTIYKFFPAGVVLPTDAVIEKYPLQQLMIP